MSPLISTIVPAFNSEHTLLESIRSVQAQSVGDFEILIIDDGSTDRTIDIARSIAAADPRVKVIQQKNAGVAAARNSGLEIARGEYIHFLDADDLICPDAYSDLVATERAFDGGGAVGFYESFYTPGEFYHQSSLPYGILGLPQVMLGLPLHGLSQLIKREAIGNQRFDTTYVGYEDQDFWIRLAERGVRWNTIRKTMGQYRLTPGSLSRLTSMLPCGEDVYVRAQKRNGAISELQLHEQLAAFTAIHSTRAALLAGDGVKQAAALMAGARARPTMLPAFAASCGHSQAVTALCKWPRMTDLVPGNQTVLARLKTWWQVCADNGWMRATDINDTIAEFARLCIPPHRVASALLSLSSHKVILIGFGRNANWLLKQSLSGKNICVRDDRFAGESTHMELPSPLTIEPMSAPIPPGSTVIITPTDDEPLAQRFPGAFRWSVIHNQLAQSDAQLALAA